MAELVYAKPADNVVATAAAVTPSSEEAGYEVEHLWDGNPAQPWKATTATPNIVWDFGSAQTLDYVALIHHNLDAGLNVRIQGHASDSWGAPTLDQAITIPADDDDGFPVNPWVDLTGIGSRSFRFWRLVVVGTNSVNVAIGDVWLVATKRSLVHNLSFGFVEGVRRPLIEHETDYAVRTIYDLGTKVRSITGSVKTTLAGLTAIRQWWDACHGRALPTLIIPHPAINEALLVRWREVHREDERIFNEIATIHVAWDEVSRGLVL